jgi:primase-polymerase (primpol)-like protein
MTRSFPLSIADFRVPHDLTERDQWVLWRYSAPHGKRSKVPYHVSGTPASSTDPCTRDSFEAVFNAWIKAPRRHYAGPKPIPVR